MAQLGGYRDGSVHATLLCRVGRDEFATGDSLAQVLCFKENGSGALADVTAYEVGDDTITAIAVNKKDQECAVAYSNAVSIREYPNMDKEKMGLAVRSTLLITHLAYDIGGRHLFVASQEPDIKVYNSLTNSIECKISTRGFGVHFFSQSPDGSLLAVLDEEGTVTIHRLIVTSSAGGVRSFSGSDLLYTAGEMADRAAVRDYSAGYFTFSWHPTKAILAVPGKKGDLIAFEQSEVVGDGCDWNELYYVMSEDDVNRHDEGVTTVAYSPNGNYIASADKGGVILIWETDQQEAIVKHHCAERVSNLFWGLGESDNYLVVGCKDQKGRIEDVLPSQFGSATAGYSAPMSPSPVKSVSSTAAAASVTEVGETHLDMEVEGVEAATAPTTTLPQRAHSGNWSAFDKESSSTSTTGADAGAGAPEKPPLDLGGDDDDDEFGGSVELLKRRIMGIKEVDEEGAEGEEVEENFDDVDGTTEEITPVEETTMEQPHEDIVLQPPFQVSSTTFDDKRRKYFVWNAYGYIISRDDKLSKRVDMTVWSDPSGRRREESFTDNYGFAKGSIGPQGAAFSSYIDDLPAAGEEAQGSTIHYHAFSGFEANETFTTTLPAGEAVETIAVGSGWVAVATSKQYLRVFSSTGLQLMISWLKGPVVTIVGSGPNLAVLYHSAPPCNDSFNISVELLEIGAETSVRQLALAKVPLTPGHLLSWAGICPNSGLLGYMQLRNPQSTSRIHTSGMNWNGSLSVMVKSAGWQFIPVLDLSDIKKSVDDFFWPVAIIDGGLECVLLKAVSKPSVFPLPTRELRPFKMPVAQVSGTRNLNEAQNDRFRSLLWETAQATHIESIKSDLDPLLVLPDGYSLLELQERVDAQAASADKTVLKMLQESCRAKRIPLSFDLARRLRTEQACQAAIKIANHFGQPALAFALEDTLKYKQELAATFAAAEAEAEADLVSSSRSKENNINSNPIQGESVFSNSKSVGMPLVSPGSAERRQVQSYTASNSLPLPGLRYPDSASKRVMFGDAVAASPARGTPSNRVNKFARKDEFGSGGGGGGMFSPQSNKRDRDRHSPSPAKTLRLGDYEEVKSRHEVE